MQKSQLIKLYKCLTKGERKQLKKWVNSPIHNQHKEVVALFEYLDNKIDLTDKWLDKKRIYSYLFLEESYSDARLRHIQSYAFSVLEKFVGYNQCFLVGYNQQKMTLEHYRSNQLPKLHQKTLRKAEKTLHQRPQRNAAFHLDAYGLEEERFKMGSTQRRMEGNNLPQLFTHLSEFFVLTTLKYACTAATHRNIYNTEYQIPFLEAVLNYADEEEVSMSVKIYYQAYLALTLGDVLCFELLKEDLFDHLAVFDEEERYELFQICINFCIRKINTGYRDYFEEVFDLYQEGLRTEILLDKGVLSRFTYKNIVSAGLKLQAFEWVHDFIEIYNKKLSSAFQDTYGYYSKAKLAFIQGDYGQALTCLLKVEDYDDLFLTLDAKMMLLKIYYEENSIDALTALIASFYVFLRRKEVMSYHKEVYKNTLRLTQKLLQIRPQDQNAKLNLKKKIQTLTPLVEQEWLLKQVDLL